MVPTTGLCRTPAVPGQSERRATHSRPDTITRMSNPPGERRPATPPLQSPPGSATLQASRHDKLLISRPHHQGGRTSPYEPRPGAGNSGRSTAVRLPLGTHKIVASLRPHKFHGHVPRSAITHHDLAVVDLLPLPLGSHSSRVGLDAAQHATSRLLLLFELLAPLGLGHGQKARVLLLVNLGVQGVGAVVLRQERVLGMVVVRGILESDLLPAAPPVAQHHPKQGIRHNVNHCKLQHGSSRPCDEQILHVVVGPRKHNGSRPDNHRRHCGSNHFNRSQRKLLVVLSRRLARHSYEEALATPVLGLQGQGAKHQD
mmetsp:Transcript_40979/g.92437  ORF Transcript_40979/g.92437 Transcript_40979/m.92437 type:complete len:314 (-) Transcript_40979:1621-2562(-)